jgi:hypothetical protein
MSQYAGLIRRAITGAILGGIVGMIEFWFFQHDLMHIWAAMAAGSVYITALTLFTDHLRLAGGKTLLGAVAGLFAAMVWWAMAVQTSDAFVMSAVAGLCFGAAYVWSEPKKQPPAGDPGKAASE